MKFGLTDAEWQTVETLAIKPLKKFGAHVFVFGSRARGTHQPYSDLDLMFENPTQEIQLSDLAHIKDALENSKLPIKVDIADSSELASSYRESALKDRISV